MFAAIGAVALLRWVPITTNPAPAPVPLASDTIARPIGKELIPGARNFFATGAATVGARPTIEFAWEPIAAEAALAANPTGDIATRILAAEGGPGRNPASSAAGYGQFLRATWLDLFGRAYPDLARKLSPDQILALRDVKPLAADLTRQYARENSETLSRQGVSASDAVLSLAHAVGPAGAAGIVMAPPTQPVRELLSPEAIAANPQFATLTASSLRQWAANRIGAEGVASPAIAAARRPPNSAPVIAPSEDFRVDGGKLASAVVQTNQTRITRLRQAAAVLSSANGRDYRLARGKPVSAPPPDQSTATEAVFAALHALAKKPENERLQYFLNYARQPARIPPSILGHLALVLIDKLEEENTILIHRARQLHASIKAGSN